MSEKKINYVVRELSPEGNDMSYVFDDDGLTERSGDWNNNLFIVINEGWGRIYGFNIETYKEVRRAAENLIDAFEDVGGLYGYSSFKEAMESVGITYNSRKCHALKEWANDPGDLDTDTIAGYLTITTGKNWNSIGVCGYCQGDYVEVVYCEGRYTEESARYYGECYLGCAREYGVIGVENCETDEDGELCYDEVDSCYGYIVSDSQAWREADVKRLVCEWAGIPEDETVLELIDWNNVRTYTHYGYRTA